MESVSWGDVMGEALHRSEEGKASCLLTVRSFHHSELGDITQSRDKVERSPISQFHDQALKPILPQSSCSGICGVGDEPTASLTQKEQYLLFKVVRDLRDSGVAVISISHRLEELSASLAS